MYGFLTLMQTDWLATSSYSLKYCAAWWRNVWGSYVCKRILLFSPSLPPLGGRRERTKKHLLCSANSGEESQQKEPTKSYGYPPPLGNPCPNKGGRETFFVCIYSTEGTGNETAVETEIGLRWLRQKKSWFDTRQKGTKKIAVGGKDFLCVGGEDKKTGQDFLSPFASDDHPPLKSMLI